GIQYMTVESIYGKSHAKERIIGAVTGLMLSVGIVVILNTINPQLLQINFGSNLDSVEVGGSGDSVQGIDVNENKYGRYTIAGKTYATNEQTGEWPPIGTKNISLFSLREKVQSESLNNVTFSNPECTTWHQGPGCISTWYEQDALNKIFTKLKGFSAECNNCSIVVTEGTKVWAHMSHATWKPTLDLRSNSEVSSWNKYLTGKENPYIDEPNHKQCKSLHLSKFNSDFETVLFEGLSCGEGSSYTAGQHLHVKFK
ncbi:MAG: hypothetical protein LR005_00670, partial [Candidatus Pacebacteria bacterium]|nr:hypothetical protein [Candidatus Paceibacterota bacterium]